MTTHISYTEEALKRLDECIATGDTEIAHMTADGVLCDLLILLGYEEVVEKYEKVSKWYA